MLKRIAGVLATATAAIGLLAGGASAAEMIRIGSFVSATGPASFLGDPEKKVLELYVDKINKDGGINGRKIELIVYDDSGDAAKAGSFAKRLVESDKVDVIVGGTTTAATMAAVPLVERSEVPFVSLAGAVVIVEPVKKWVFKTPHTDRMAAEKVMLDLTKRGLSKLALLSEDSGFGKSGREETLKVAKERGIEVVADEVYGAKDTDVTAQLTKIRNNAQAQAVLVFGLGQGPAVVTRNYRQLGISLPLYHGHGVASKEFIKLAGGAAEGVRLPAAGLVVAEQLPDSDPQKKVVTAFAETYQKQFQSEPSTFAGHAYDGLMIAVEAIKRAGSSDKAKIRDEIEKTAGYVGTGGTVTMSATDHMGLALDAFHMVEIKQGNWQLAD